MAVRLRPLDPDAVDDVPGDCRSCVFWELGAQRPDRDATDRCGRDRVRKQAWTTSVTLETGAPGVLVLEGQRTVGWASFAPAERYAPRAAGVPPTTAGSLLLATVEIHQTARSAGGGRRVVVAAVREALRLGLDAVEAYGDRRGRPGQCVLPATWLVHQGFEVAVEHPRYPLHRLEVHRAVPWAESIEQAVEQLLRRAPRRAPAAAPVPTSTR